MQLQQKYFFLFVCQFLKRFYNKNKCRVYHKYPMARSHIPCIFIISQDQLHPAAVLSFKSAENSIHTFTSLMPTHSKGLSQIPDLKSESQGVSVYNSSVISVWLCIMASRLFSLKLYPDLLVCLFSVCFTMCHDI